MKYEVFIETVMQKELDRSYGGEGGYLETMMNKEGYELITIVLTPPNCYGDRSFKYYWRRPAR